MLDPIEKFDVDGDLREAAEAAGIDRSAFLRGGALAGAGVVAGGALFGLPAIAEATTSSRHKSVTNDRRILNFALTLEFLESQFYRAAIAANAFTDTTTGSVAQISHFAQIVAGHEQKHDQFLRELLGSKAVRKPRFDFGDAVAGQRFMDTAVALEDTGVAAYAGQAANLKTSAYLRGAASILAVEGRHASWARLLNGGAAADAEPGALPAPEPFDPRRSERAILARVDRTGFVRSRLSHHDI